MDNKLFRASRQSLVGEDLRDLSLVLAAWVLLGFVAIRGIDYHHQGLVFSESLRVAHGQVLYRDIFSQYGPIPTYGQALFIKLFGERLTSVVLLSLCLHFMSSAMMYLLWKRKHSRSTATYGIVIWVTTSYFLRMDYPFFPWWGDFVIFFSCLTISVVYVIETGRKKEKSNHFFEIVLGLSLFAIVLTRYHIGIAMILLLGIYFGKEKKSLHYFWRAAFITLVLLSIVFLAWHRTGVLPYVIYQTITWPLEWVSGAMTGSPPIDRVIYAFVILGLTPLLSIILAAFVISDLRVHHLRSRTWISAVGLFALYRIPQMLSTNYWPRASGPFIIGPLGPDTLLWVVSVIFIISLHRKLPRVLNLEILRGRYTVNELVAIVILFGIYPVPDHAHLWMSVLPLLGPSIAAVLKIAEREKAIGVVSNIVLLWVLVVGVTFGVRKTQSELFTKSENKFTVGMYESVESNTVRSPVFDALSLLIQKDQEMRVLNFCQDAMYDSFGAQRKGIDPYNFRWGPGANGMYLPSNFLGPERMTWIRRVKPIIVTCGPDRSLDDQVFALKYEKYFDTQTEGSDYLGGQLSIRILTPTKLDKNEFDFNEQ